MQMPQPLFDKLKKLVDRVGVNDAAILIGVTKGTINNWMAGKEISFSSKVKLEVAFGDGPMLEFYSGVKPLPKEVQRRIRNLAPTQRQQSEILGLGKGGAALSRAFKHGVSHRLLVRILQAL